MLAVSGAEPDRLRAGDRAALQPLGQSLAFDVLHHEKVDAILVPDVVQRADKGA